MYARTYVRTHVCVYVRMHNNIVIPKYVTVNGTVILHK
jgi:hypothetical protein